MRIQNLAIALPLFVALLFGAAAHGQSVETDQPVLMTADDLAFDEDLGTAPAPIANTF